MCTGIMHSYRCTRCNGLTHIMRDAAPGYTCPAARQNGLRGTCRTGVEYTRYDRWDGEDLCAWCELGLASATTTTTTTSKGITTTAELSLTLTSTPPGAGDCGGDPTPEDHSAYDADASSGAEEDAFAFGQDSESESEDDDEDEDEDEDENEDEDTEDDGRVDRKILFDAEADADAEAVRSEPSPNDDDGDLYFSDTAANESIDVDTDDEDLHPSDDDDAESGHATTITIEFYYGDNGSLQARFHGDDIGVGASEESCAHAQEYPCKGGEAVDTSIVDQLDALDIAAPTPADVEHDELTVSCHDSITCMLCHLDEPDHDNDFFYCPDTAARNSDTVEEDVEVENDETEKSFLREEMSRLYESPSPISTATSVGGNDESEDEDEEEEEGGARLTVG
ncbi:hypothetical protein F5Y17DRAFT_418455 [Xylariaceae sp. FL0594]|nr:hypothetical protein F5Y17DRAFT_418455 [Xylariaceae sp. FL0594]